MSDASPAPGGPTPAMPGVSPAKTSIGFRSATMRVTLGSATGYLVTLALTPVLSRIYGPAAFGISATIIAVISVFTGVSTFRMEIFAQRSTDERESRTFFIGALCAAAVWGLVLTIAGLVAVALGANWLWVLVGALVFLASLQLVGGSILTRERSYGSLAAANFTQGAGTGVVQVALGLLQASPLSLVLGFGAARLVWFAPLRKLRAPRVPLAQTITPPVRRDAGMAGLSALVNSLGGQLTILLASLFYGQIEAGLLAMAIRLLVSPLAIVGQAAASASLGELGRLIRERSSDGPAVVKRSMRDLSLVGAIPCVGLAALGLFFAPQLLGPEWADAGRMMALLAPGTLLQFVVSPFSQLLNLSQRTRQLLVWDISRVVILAASLTLPWVFGASILVTVACYSAALVPLYVWMAYLVRSAVRKVAQSSLDET